MALDFGDKLQRLSKGSTYSHLGKIDKIVGLMVESIGPTTSVGEICKIHTPSGKTVNAEVTGFRENKVLLMPYAELAGVAPGSIVEATKSKLMIPVSNKLVGRIVNAIGEPIDGLGDLSSEARYEVETGYSNPFDRPRIDTKMTFGVKAIDGVLTIDEDASPGTLVVETSKGITDLSIDTQLGNIKDMLLED
jgi:flagellum-specific ATP synthase